MVPSCYAEDLIINGLMSTEKFPFCATVMGLQGSVAGKAAAAALLVPWFQT